MFERFASKKLFAFVAIIALYTLLVAVGVEPETAGKLLDIGIAYLASQGLVDVTKEFKKFRETGTIEAVPAEEDSK